MPQAASWSGMPAIRGRSETTRMALLTFSLIGIQFTWGIEMTYGTPYLLSLGLSKSRMSAVWIAGPLSGLIVQPLVGVIADNSRSKYGRRRPFMLIGSLAVAVCLFVMGWTAEIVEKFDPRPEAKPTWNIIVAIGSIYAVDFSINVVQCCCRSLIVDTLPVSKQQLGNAWASRMAAIGHLIGYGIGTIDLRALWGDWLGNTQFKQLCVIAAFALIFACSVTAYCVTERILISATDADKASGAWYHLAKLFKMTLSLPPRIRAICWVQFWAWIGWFPFLFYSPTWVGETYFRYSAPADLSPSTDRLGEIGRIGSMSLVIFSAITFLASVVFPFLIRSPATPASRTFTPRPHPLIAPIVKALRRFHKHRPDLLTAWRYANIIFGLVMLTAPLIHSVGAASFLVAVAGFPWAIACWAPFAFMGVEVNQMSAPRNPHYRASSITSGGSPFPRPSFDSTPSQNLPNQLHLKHSEDSRTDSFELDAESDSEASADGFITVRRNASKGNTDVTSSTGETAGMYLGVLNVFTTLPQFVGTFISMIVFAIFEPGRSRELAGHHDDQAAAAAAAATKEDSGVNAISICLFIGGACALMAAYATKRLRNAR